MSLKMKFIHAMAKFGNHSKRLIWISYYRLLSYYYFLGLFDD